MSLLNMHMSTTQCFSTPIYTRQLEGLEFAQVQAEIVAAMSQIQAGAAASPWAELGTTTFNFEGCNDILHHRMTTLERSIAVSMQQYLDSIHYPASEFTVMDSWFNWYGRGDFMFEHLHPHRRVSGCYYYSSTGQDGDIKFRNPSTALQLGQFPADLQPQQDHMITPCSGLMVLFPSWVWHRVSPNTTDTTRISLAFNLA